MSDDSDPGASGMPPPPKSADELPLFPPIPKPPPGPPLHSDRKRAEAAENRLGKPGCTIAFIAAIVIVGAGAWMLLTGDDVAPTECAFAAQVECTEDPTTTTTETDEPDETTTTTAEEEEPTDDGGPVAAPPVGEPPAVEDLPNGAILFQGSSGDPIGCIPCDGLLRFMSVDDPGVTSGVEGGPEELAVMSAPLQSDGVVSDMGARVSSADGGNWTLNVRCLSTTTAGSCNQPPDQPSPGGTVGYILSCALEAGDAACASDPEAHPPVKAGDRLALAMGNPGDPITQGEFTVDWWFVFEPA